MKGSSFRLAILVTALAGLTLDANAGPRTARTYTIYGSTVPLHDLEVVPDGEIKAINETNEIIKTFFKTEYQKETTDGGSGLVIHGTRRGVHPRAHGCLVGTLHVARKKDLALKDRAGIFQPGAQYPVTVRFSNASPRATTTDWEADARGIGIKIHNVGGRHILDSTAPGVGSGNTQEFTLNNGDAFFSDTAETYRKFMEISLLKTKTLSDAGQRFVFELVNNFQFELAFRVTMALKQFQDANPTNPLALQYYSITPLQHGAGPSAPIVKHSVVPCEGTWTEEVDAGDNYFLRTHLKKYIAKKEACFKYLIQHRTGTDLPVEDPTEPWDISSAPFQEVGVIKLPIQNLLAEEDCERIVINPWNTLAEHKPVGGINRLRLGAYLMSIQERLKSKR